MYHATAQTVIDNETKYRPGVLIGNFAEETLSKDYIPIITNIKDSSKTPLSMMKVTHSLYNTVANKEKDTMSPEEIEHKNLVRFNAKGESSKILFGHGIKPDDFDKRDFKTTNELSYSSQVKPTEFINSKFYPEQTRKVLSFQSENKKNITLIGDVDKGPRYYKKYDEFCKQFDAQPSKTGLRK